MVVFLWRDWKSFTVYLFDKYTNIFLEVQFYSFLYQAIELNEIYPLFFCVLEIRYIRMLGECQPFWSLRKSLLLVKGRTLEWSITVQTVVNGTNNHQISKQLPPRVCSWLASFQEKGSLKHRSWKNLWPHEIVFFCFFFPYITITKHPIARITMETLA